MKIMRNQPEHIDVEPDLVFVDNEKGRLRVICLTSRGRRWGRGFIPTPDVTPTMIPFFSTRPSDLPDLEGLVTVDITGVS